MPINTSNLTPFTHIDQMRVGQQVVCMYRGTDLDRYGQPATIKSVYSRAWNIIRPGDYSAWYFRVEWQDGSRHAIKWGNADSFAPADPTDIQHFDDQQRRKAHADKYL